MKSIKKLTVYALAGMLVLSLTACGTTPAAESTEKTEAAVTTPVEETTEAETTVEDTTAAEETEEETTEEAVEGSEAEGVDFTAYPEAFEDWTINDVQTYLKDSTLLNNEEFLLVSMSDTDVTPIHAAGGFMYMDSQAASVVDIIYSFDVNDEDSKATLDSTIENKAIMYEGNPVAPMDAVIGQFAFSYMNGTDDEYINAFTQALVDLCAHFEMEASYMPEN